MTGHETRTGRAGEHFVAYLIETIGLEAVRVDGACDLHVTLNSGRVMRFEVKTCGVRRGPSFKFSRGGSSADVYALVAMTDQPVVRFFLAGMRITRNETMTVPASEFTLDHQNEDLKWISCLT